MDDSKAKAALQVAEYRRLSGLHRANSKLQVDSADAPYGIASTNGIVIVRAAPRKKSMKTVTEAGGPSEVFGQSTISIPECRKPALRK